MTFTLLLGSLSFSFRLPSQLAKGFQLCQSRRGAEIWRLWRLCCPEWNLFSHILTQTGTSFLVSIFQQGLRYLLKLALDQGM